MGLSKLMRKRSIGIILLIIFILVLCCGIPITKLTWSRYNRHKLFCETLKPGMSISEVSDILNETGNVIIRMTYDNSRYQYTQYSILFTDKNVQDKYGGWTELIFLEGEYSRAYIEGFELESIDVICDFSQTIQSATATSKP